MKKYIIGMLAAFLFMWVGRGHGIVPILLLPVIFANPGADRVFTSNSIDTLGLVLFYLSLLLLLISLFIKQRKALLINSSIAIAFMLLSVISFAFSTQFVFFWPIGILIFISFAIAFFIAVRKKFRHGNYVENEA